MKRSRLAIPIIAFLALGVAEAGPRLMAVGHWGHVVLSDDGGESGVERVDE